MVIEPSLERVREARELLHGHFGATRVVEAQFLARRTGKRLRLKLETQLRTGSFRVRGAVWALAARSKRESIAGVVASSTGNHGAAVAWTGRSQLLEVGLPVTWIPVLDLSDNPVTRTSGYHFRIARLRQKLPIHTNSTRISPRYHGNVNSS